MLGISATALAVCVAIAICGGAFRGFAGFGSGLIMSPILLMFFPPIVAIPAMLIFELIASLRLVYEARKDIEWRRVAWFGVPACVSVQIGAYALAVADAATIKTVVSIVVLISVVLIGKGYRYQGRLGPKVSGVAGLIGGFLSAMAGVGGPPIVLTMMADESPEENVRANLIGYFLLVGGVSMMTYFLAGMLSMKSVVFAGASLVPYLIATHIGALAFRKYGGTYFRPAALALLAIVATASLIL